MKLAKYQSTLSESEPLATGDDFLVPSIVQNWGDLVGVLPSSIVGEWDTTRIEQGLANSYEAIAAEVATLLAEHGVSEVHEDDLAQARSRWASRVDAWVALSTRVDALYRAYRLRDETALVPAAAKLWATLEVRCSDVTGQAWTAVLRG